MNPARRIAVVGGGWAGLACAEALAAAGQPPTLIEAARAWGGRARATELDFDGIRLKVDNGQHLMIGAYREVLALIERVNPGAPLQRLPLRMRSREMVLERRGPGRLGLAIGLAMAAPLPLAARLGMARMGVALGLARWRGFDGITVETLLARQRQHPQAVRAFWDPLCVAALNTPIDIACAQTFVNVLHDALAATADGSDFIVARTDLGSLLAEPVAASLARSGATLLSGVRVTRIDRDEAGERGWTLTLSDGSTRRHDALVLATPPWQSATLLRELHPEVADRLGRFRFEPIQTVFATWDARTAIALPDIAMLEVDAACAQFGQWLFARPEVPEVRLATVVISARSRVEAPDSAAIERAVGDQLQAQLGLPAPRAMRSINEKRATFQCTPDRPQASPRRVDELQLPADLLLAGDYCEPRYPGTLEGAVRSGRAAAHCLLDEATSDSAARH